MMNDPMHFTEHRLKSGLTVFFQHRDLPWFECIMVVGAGIRHDPIGKEGLSHLVEHTLSCGTAGMKKMNLVELQRWIAARKFIFDLGSTRLDCSQYQGKSYTRNTKRFFSFLNDFLRRPTLESVEHEREIIRNERDEGPGPRRREMLVKLRQAAFGDHRMSSVNAVPEDEILDNLTIDDVRNFHGRHYRPENMTLIVVGGLKRKRLLDTLESVFIPEKSAFVPVEKPPPIIRRVPDPRELTTSHYEGDGPQTVEVAYGWHTPPLDHCHVVLLREIMKDILMLKLREELQFTYGVSCDNDRFLDHSTFSIMTEVSPENVDQTRQVIEATLADIPTILKFFPYKKAEYCSEIGFIDFSVGEMIDVVAKTVAVDGKPRLLREARDRYESCESRDIERLLGEYINKKYALINIIEW